MTTSLVKTYYDALAEGRLVAHRCTDCATITFPQTGCCESCGSYSHEDIELSGRGTLLFASHNLAACHPRFVPYAPYAYGHVVMEEGVTVQGMVQGVDGTADAIAELYPRLPLPVVAEVLRTDDLPVLTFRLA
jgi:uncharacterized OB-fold protein